ncbi:hypothetical protein ASF92_09750 [Pedobacter sp. Leaf176]|nr:hypothetical protein ASF92_09750 [Pedobacter sp. Leaf176]
MRSLETISIPSIKQESNLIIFLDTLYGFPYPTGKLLLKHLQKLISHGNTEITEEIKFFRVFRASVANIMLRHAQKVEKLSEKS